MMPKGARFADDGGQVSLCCTPCGIAQMNTEMKDRAEKAQLLPPQGYQAHPQGMTYQQPQPQPQPMYPVVPHPQPPQ